jgi:hypothetical protein
MDATMILIDSDAELERALINLLWNSCVPGKIFSNQIRTNDDHDSSVAQFLKIGRSAKGA